METNICGKTAGAKYNFVNFLAHRPKSDLLKFGNKVKDSENSSQFNMFGESEEASIQSPVPSASASWTAMEMLSKEKDVVGIYLSGHPLDDYKLEINNFCNGNLSMLHNMDKIKAQRLFGVFL